MPMDIPILTLLAFVIFHGIAFGAGLYEQRVVVPRWMGRSSDGAPYLDSNAMRIDDTGRRFWGFVSTGPLSILLLVNLYFAAVSASPARSLWLAACAITLVERIYTFSFFIPRAIRLMREAMPASAETIVLALHWRSANRIRLALSLAAWLVALVAVASYR
jgi:hypothetical protein